MAEALLLVDKGDNVRLNIDKSNGGQILIGCGWNPRVAPGDTFDVDAWLIMLGADNKAVKDMDGVPYGIVFYGNPEIKEYTGEVDELGNKKFVLKAKDGSVLHHGDNRTGEGSGDDEVIDLWLDRVDPRVVKIIIAASIYKGKERGQTFGQIDDAYLHCNVPGDTDYRCLLSEDYSKAHTVVLGQLYRDPSDPTGWKFKSVMDGFPDELIDVGKAHGVPLG